METTIQPGSRVTWFADEDFWGTVVEVYTEHLLVRWDDAGTRTTPRTSVRLRHNMAVPTTAGECECPPPLTRPSDHRPSCRFYVARNARADRPYVR